jgi:hypothetical protein
MRLGQVQFDVGNFDGAASAWKRACGHYDAVNPLNGETIFLRALCHAGLARLAGQPNSGLLTSEAANQADKAMALLRKAAASGYRSPDAYRTESALNPLRARHDFQLLMMDVAFPTEPFVP